MTWNMNNSTAYISGNVRTADGGQSNGKYHTASDRRLYFQRHFYCQQPAHALQSFPHQKPAILQPGKYRPGQPGQSDPLALCGCPAFWADLLPAWVQYLGRVSYVGL